MLIRWAKIGRAKMRGRSLFRTQLESCGAFRSLPLAEKLLRCDVSGLWTGSPTSDQQCVPLRPRMTDLRLLEVWSFRGTMRLEWIERRARRHLLIVLKICDPETGRDRAAFGSRSDG